MGRGRGRGSGRGRGRGRRVGCRVTLTLGVVQKE